MAQFYGAPPMALLTVGLSTLLLGKDLIGLTLAVRIDAVLWGLGTLTARRREFETLATASAESREELRVLADQQAALHRVATLVAHGLPPAEVFAAVAQEVSHVLGAGGGGARSPPGRGAPIPTPTPSTSPRGSPRSFAPRACRSCW
jgi:hypothetical protein